jgi:uncharacterized membrane protein (DUF485 family)
MENGKFNSTQHRRIDSIPTYRNVVSEQSTFYLYIKMVLVVHQVSMHVVAAQEEDADLKYSSS